MTVRSLALAKHSQRGEQSAGPLLAESCSQTVPRGPDRYPSEYGQWGVAAHYLAEGLNNTEFGFYFLNYSSRLPLFSGIAATTTNATSGSYFLEYPSDIHMFGVSFNTQLEASGVALQGEFSYRPNQPLQINTVELLFAGLSPLNQLIPAPANRYISQLGTYAPGDYIPGYTRQHLAQLQFTATKVFGPNNFSSSRPDCAGGRNRRRAMSRICRQSV